MIDRFPGPFGDQRFPAGSPQGDSPAELKLLKNNQLVAALKRREESPPVDNQTRRRLLALGLPEKVIDHWRQYDADWYLRLDGATFDPRLVAGELAEIEKKEEEKRRHAELLRELERIEEQRRRALDSELRAIGWGTASSQPPPPVEDPAWRMEHPDEPPRFIDTAVLLRKYRGTDRWAEFFTCDPSVVKDLVRHVQDADFPSDILQTMQEYAVVALRDRAQLKNFWELRQFIFCRIRHPVTHEMVDFHGGQESARSTPVTPQVVEQLPPAPPLAQAGPASPLSFEPNAVPAETAECNRAAALALAEAGIPVFPVRLNWNIRKGKWDKPPAIDEWQEASTTDAEQIRAWWRDLPAALGIPAHHLVSGIWCGHPAIELVVIDADRHGGPDGVAAFEALVEENWLPIGPVTKTPTDGRHYFFKKPHGQTFGDATGSLPDGIDVRGSGFVVGPGSVRPDGVVWKGHPSLIEIGLNNVPELPDWIMALIRTSKLAPKKVPKEKPETEQQPTLTSSSGRRTVLPTKYGTVALECNAAELAETQPGSRNNKANAIAYRMGRLSKRERLDPDDIRNALFAACEANGLVRDKGADAVRATIESGLNAGMANPLPKQIDGRRKGTPDRVKSIQPHHVHQLLRIRFGDNVSVEAAYDVLAKIPNDADGAATGEALKFTFAEYQEFKRRGWRHPSTIRPFDVTIEGLEAYHKALRGQKRPERNAAARAYRLRMQQAKARQPSTQPAEPTFEAKRWRAIIALLEKHPKPYSIGQLVTALKRSAAFAGLTDKTRRNAILKTMKGKAPGKLSERLIITSMKAKNRKTTTLVELRKDITQRTSPSIEHCTSKGVDEPK